jgi:hypothetical protein
MAHTCLKILAIIAVVVSSQAKLQTNIKEIPYGVFLTEIGSASLSENQFEVAIVRSHPQVATKLFGRKIMVHVSAILRDTVRHANESDHELIALYKRRLHNLRAYQHRTKRYAPLQFIGDLAHSIFGTATSKDVDEIRNTVNNVIQNARGQYKMMKGLTIALNETIHAQSHVQQTVETLIERARVVEMSIRSLNENMNKLLRQAV